MEELPLPTSSEKSSSSEVMPITLVVNADDKNQEHELSDRVSIRSSKANSGSSNSAHREELCTKNLPSIHNGSYFRRCFGKIHGNGRHSVRYE
ncbi:hypothetical protein NECAME_14653 [Necator americanus]|uniref:Uncharacterized protein n=1 Tax=Necator americanus TaxID=51031 RepID=W2SM48_NECAM|nr:hypothetical protein NECAME_14653 [Necator americanus]ETN70618.1 hypothetical protein NECAME_14653 [Necator americanus]